MAYEKTNNECLENDEFICEYCGKKFHNSEMAPENICGTSYICEKCGKIVDKECFSKE